MLLGGLFSESCQMASRLTWANTARAPVRALPFARWLVALTSLHYDIIEDFVESLREGQPDRFNDPFSGSSENLPDIHHAP